jgi:hypothetical protein
MTQAEQTEAIGKCLASLGKNRKIQIDYNHIRANNQLSRAESGAIDFLRRNGYTIVLTGNDQKKPAIPQHLVLVPSDGESV